MKGTILQAAGLSYKIIFETDFHESMEISYDLNTYLKDNNNSNCVVTPHPLCGLNYKKWNIEEERGGKDPKYPSGTWFTDILWTM